MKRSGLLLAGTLCALILVPTARAQLSGIQYLTSPQVTTIRFDDNSGLQNDALYGGSLGFGFGRFLELHALYLYNPRVRTDFTRMTGFEPGTRELLDFLPRKTVRMDVAGGELRLNLAYGSFFPFLTLGAGAVRLEPENQAESWTVYASGSLGLQYTMARRYALYVRAEDMAYRTNVASSLLTEPEIARAGLTPEDFRTQTVNNLSVRVGLQVYLGGQSPDQLSEVDRALQEQLRGGLRNLNLLIEPTYLQFRPHASLGMKKSHYLYGASAGLDLGPYAGLRGFFWRDQNWKEVQGYGGEFRLNFRAYGQTTYPFISLGGGYLDILPDYPVAEGSTPPEDQTFLLGGAGLHMALNSRIHLTGMVRTMVTAATDVTRVTSPSDIQTSWVYSGGISFRLGATPKPRRTAPTPAVLPPTTTAEAEEIARREAEILALRRQLDSLNRQLTTAAPTASTAPVPSTAAPAPEQPAATTPTITPKTKEPQVVTFPVPESGEIYVRYGPPGGVTVESLSGEAAPIVIDATTGQVITRPSEGTRTTMPPVATQTVDTTGLRLLIRRIVQEEIARQPLTPAIQALEQRLARLEARLSVEAPQTPSVNVQVATPEVSGRQFSGILPFTGISAGFGTHWVFGIRTEFLNTMRPSLRFSPELVYGFGGGPNLLNLNGNGIFMPNLRIARKFQPYVGAGLGFLDSRNFEVVFNILLGVQGDLRYGTFFAEWMDQDFLSGDRLIIGYRVNL